jgi:hypothetical protein
MMGDFLPPGSCDDEKKAARDAQKNLERAFRAHQSARHNFEAGFWATGAAGVTALGCAAAATGIGAIFCVAGAGGAMASGELWTLSAGEALEAAKEELDDAFDAMDDALDKLCACLDQNMLSVPD